MGIRTFDTHETVPRAVELSVSAVGADGELHPGSYNSLELGEVPGEVVAIEVRAFFDEDDLEIMLPEDELNDPPVRLMLVMKSRSRGAFRRQAIRLLNNVSDRLEFDRRNWRGQVELQAVLVRTTDRDAAHDSFASRAGARLAWSEQWSVWIDDRPDFAGKSLPIEWISFHESKGAWSRFKGSYFFLDFDSGPTPKLLLNADHDDFVRVIQNNATHGKDARARDAASTLIAHQVWTSLILEAAARIRAVVSAMPEARDDVDLLSAELPEWCGRVIGDWAQSLTGVRARDEAVSTFVQWSVDASTDLNARVLLAIQERFQTRRGFEGVLKKL